MANPILVTGATGTIGTFVVRALHRQGLPVRALVRSSARASSIAQDGVDCVVADLTDPTSLAAPMRGIERAFLLTPGMPFHPQAVNMAQNFVNAAKEAGVCHIVVQSIFGISAESDKPQLFQDHAKTRALLEASGIPFTLLRTNYGMQSLAGQGMLQSAQHDGIIADSLGEAGVAYIDLRDVAEVAAKCLTSDGHAGRTYVLSGPEVLTASRLAAILGEVCGREVKAIVPTPAQVAEKMRSFGMSQEMIDHSANLGASNRTGALGVLSGDIHDVLKRPPTSFRRFAEDALRK